VRNKIWYREELEVLRDLVIQEVGVGAAHHNMQQRVALGALYGKLIKAIDEAPSLRTPEAAA
jgi:hypothetical protein